MYASEWYLTLFSYRFSVELSSRVWDLFFVDGVAAVHRIALVLISRLHDRLLASSFEHAVPLLKGCSADANPDVIMQVWPDTAGLTRVRVGRNQYLMEFA
jgi:hypothetical protein